MILLEDFRLSF